MDKEKLDLSVGDALRPFKGLARLAFEEASSHMNMYVNDPKSKGWSAPEPLQAAQESFHGYLKDIGWKRPAWSGVGYDCFAFLDGGTTRGFDLILQVLSEKYKRLEREGAGKPVLIMPVPTYGYFTMMPDLYGIDVIKVERDLENQAALDMDKLTEAIKGCHDKGQTILGYYDCSPNNPMGFVRSAEETTQVAQTMAKLKNIYEADAKMRNSSFPYLIDDQVYRGLVYGKDCEIPSFSQVQYQSDENNLFDQTLTLFGPSKSGLAGIRTGIVVGESSFISNIQHLQQHGSYFPSYLSLATIRHFYASEGEGANMRKRFIGRLNSDHRFGGLIMKALINGMDTMSELSQGDRDRIIKTVSNRKNITQKEVISLLSEGIRGVSIITTPEAGFFHVIDLNKDEPNEKVWRSAEKGQLYSSVEKSDNLFDKKVTIETLLKDDNVSLAYLQWAGYEAKESLRRVSFAVPLLDIFSFTDRLKAASDKFYSVISEQQMVDSEIAGAKGAGRSLSFHA
ncbi:MAG: hypothetical protein CMH28_04650 [Micavibrio sp.]|nr:hypothetical protein [Micavibrio sp.]